MAFGSVSTLDPSQQLYMTGLLREMTPWIGRTGDRLSEYSSSPISSYSPMENWDQYIKSKYTAPAQYTLSQTLANLQASPERFSFGRQYREAQAMNQMNQGVGNSVMNELMNERKLQMNSQASALARQLQSLGVQGQSIMAPLSVKSIENTSRPKTLMDDILGIF